MQKNVVIELLQDREDVAIDSPGSDLQMLSNSSFATSTDWDVTTQSGGCTVQWVIAGGKITKTAGCSFFAHTNVQLYEGWQYEVELYVQDYNVLGSLHLSYHATGGVSVTVIDSSIIGAGEDGTVGQNYAYIKARWTQGTTNLTQLRFYGTSTMTIGIRWIKLRRVAESGQSIMGRLDATTTEDFPLSINFAVADSQNIDVRKGAYSKTFKIPATDNNNQVLKNYNIPNSTYMDSAIYDKIPCRIIVGELYSLKGLFQLKDVERINEKALLYSCVFYGDNLGWSTKLENKYLNDLQLPYSTNLELSAAEIVDTWKSDDCQNTTTVDGATTTTNTSPVVYPVASISINNESGQAGTMQLLRKQWEIDYADNLAYNVSDTDITYMAPNPVVDWRPMVWIYNMIHKIFNDIGYRVVSNFVESAEFKKLLYMTPNFLFNNPDERYQTYSYLGNFKDNTCTPANDPNQKWHSRIHRVEGNPWPSSGTNQQNSSSWTLGGLVLDGFQLGGTCGACTDADCGSGRFQPAPGVIINAGNQLQQDTVISTAGGGTSPDPFYNKWRVDEAGYYKLSTSGMSYRIRVQGSGSASYPGTGWSGDGNLNSIDTYCKLYGGLGWQVKRVNTSTWKMGTAGGTGAGSAWVPNQQNLTAGGIISNADANYTGTLDSHSIIVYLNKHDEIALGMHMYYSAMDASVLQARGSTLSGITIMDYQLELWGNSVSNYNASNGVVGIELVDPEIPAYACTYDLQNVFSSTEKQIDFVKGVAHAFNLQFNTNEAARSVEIEPYDNFYLPPSYAIDWTWKLDRSKGIVDAFIESNFTRRMIFKYKTDDKDSRVKSMGNAYFDGVEDIYPYRQDLGTQYPVGDTVFENPFFAGTYEAKNPYIGYNFSIMNGSLADPTRNFYSPVLTETHYWQNGQKYYDFLPRMLYWKKLRLGFNTIQYNWGFDTQQAGSMAACQGSAFFSKANQTADYTSLPQTAGSWCTNYLAANNLPQASFCDRFDYTNQFGLSYGNYWASDYDPSTNTYTDVGDQIGKGLYHRYYKAMMENMMQHPKKRTAYIDLKIADIANLSFRKMVYIDGVYYKILKVVDYKPHLNESTKVELQQWSPSKEGSVPTQGVWINTSSGGGGTVNDDGSSDDNQYIYD